MDELSAWLKQLENKTIRDDKYSVLLLGKSGSGRTTLVNNFFKKQDYYLHIINTNNCHNRKYLTEVMNKIITHRHTFFFDSQKKHALLIDELDGISVTEKGSLSDIIEIIKTVNKQAKIDDKYPIPIVCVSDESYLKKKNDLEKICKIIKLPPPDNTLLASIVVNWATQNEIKFSQSVLDIIIKESNKDIYRLNNILTYILLKDIKKLTQKTIVDIFKDFYNYQPSNHLYHSTERLMTENVSIDQTLFLFKQERTLLPLLLHENIDNYIKKPGKGEDKSLEQRRLELYRYLSDSMIIENLLYNKNEWDLQDLYGFKSCYMVSQLMNKYRKKGRPTIKYTFLLNRISLQHTYMHKYQDIILKTEDPNLYFDRESTRMLIRNSDRWSGKDLSDLLKIT